MRVRRLAIVLAAVVALVAAAAGPARAATGEQTWLAASDLHLNPFDRWPRPRKFGTDTNLPLFYAAIAEMKRRVPHPAVVLLPGDFFAHDFKALMSHYHLRISAEAAGIQTMQRIARAFGRAFPDAQFAIAVGNNDAPCGDYRADTGDAFQAAVARVWEPLVDRRNAAPDFARSFARGGYYTVNVTPHLRLVVVNTVLFSSVYLGSCAGGTGDAPANERAWLERTLASTPRDARDVVMMHVPIGYDVYSTETVHGYLPWMFLNGSDNDALVATLGDPAHRVAFAIAAHAHRFDFRIDGNVPIVVLGSISPVYDSNPQFFALHVSADGGLRDIDTYAFDEWTQRWIAAPSFDRAWNVARIDAGTLARIHARLETDAAARERWDEASDGWPSRREGMYPLWGRFWRVAWCAQAVLGSGFEGCAGIARRAGFARAAAVAVAVAVMAGIAGLILLVRRRVRGRS